MRRISIPLVTGAVALALLVSASALAQGGGHRGSGKNMPAFADCDLNGDGSITKQEFYEARAERIAKRAQEGRKMKNLARAPSFEDVDRDGDGGVSPAEFQAHQAERRAGGHHKRVEQESS